jgi:2-polyprenyl-3-methyl-5-hydroxy-6-metoxy-1,4-benzoquinol methylase
LGNSSKAESWDAGSQNDNVRNDFVIPNLINMLNHYKPASILDVGAATGYIARRVDNGLDYKPSWFLLDQNSELLQFAVDHLPDGMLAQSINTDFFDPQNVVAKYDAVLLSFTLLEVKSIEGAVQSVIANCAANGIVVIVLPDVWSDILTASQTDHSIATSFLTKSVAIQKVDKFTGTEYPFNAQRVELWIHKILLSGFTLEKFEIGNFENGNTYILAFKNR